MLIKKIISLCKESKMSVSDVVEIIDGNTGESYFHFCDSFGFQKVDFEMGKQRG